MSEHDHIDPPEIRKAALQLVKEGRRSIAGAQKLAGFTKAQKSSKNPVRTSEGDIIGLPKKPK